MQPNTMARQVLLMAVINTKATVKILSSTMPEITVNLTTLLCMLPLGVMIQSREMDAMALVLRLVC